MRSPTTGAVRTRADRRIAADPTSTALLLAGPSALELWPGLRRVGPVADRVLVEIDIAEQLTTAATVRVLPPRRTPTFFVTGFEWAGPSLPTTIGEVTLSYASGPATAAEIAFDSYGVAESAVAPATLQALADGFLANLARLAESRSRAA
jgi:hypothetical protein